ERDAPERGRSDGGRRHPHRPVLRAHPPRDDPRRGARPDAGDPRRRAATARRTGPDTARTRGTRREGGPMTSTEGRVSVEEGVVFGTGGGRDLRCDIYRPPGEATEPRPCVVLLHGGAWRMGDRTQLRGYGILLGRLGYVCVAP